MRDGADHSDDPASGEPATRTACPYCGVGCGVLASRSKDGAVEIHGDREHPANLGRLCSKGTALGLGAGAPGSRAAGAALRRAPVLGAAGAGELPFGSTSVASSITPTSSQKRYPRFA